MEQYSSEVLVLGRSLESILDYGGPSIKVLGVILMVERHAEVKKPWIAQL